MAAISNYKMIKITDPYPTEAGGQLLLDNDKALADAIYSWTLSGESVTEYGAVGDGTTDDSSALLAADSAAQSSSGIVLIPEGIYYIASDISLDSVVLFRGGKLKIGSGVTVTFNGPVMAPRVQIFDTNIVTPVEGASYRTRDGKVRISVTNHSRVVYPEWWQSSEDDYWS